MNALLVDSDIVIEVSRARDLGLLARWDELSQSETAILCSPVTIAEVWHGARPHEHKALSALFAAMITIPIDAEIGRRAGDYLRLYAKSHRLDLGDALIGATAAIHNVPLWTRNRRHYPMRDVTFF